MAFGVPGVILMCGLFGFVLSRLWQRVSLTNPTALSLLYLVCFATFPYDGAQMRSHYSKSQSTAPLRSGRRSWSVIMASCALENPIQCAVDRGTLIRWDRWARELR